MVTFRLVSAEKSVLKLVGAKGYRTLRVAVVPLAFWRSVGVPGAVSRHPSVFRAPCGFSYWAWPLFVPVGGGLPARPGDLLGAPRAALSSISHVIP